MNQVQAQLLLRIKAFCRDAEVSESFFGKLTVNDTKLIDRVRTSTITLDTFHKVNRFLDEQRLVARRAAYLAEQRAEIERYLAKHGAEGQVDDTQGDPDSQAFTWSGDKPAPRRRGRPRKSEEPQLGV